jgi:DNA-binding GntR family transcriptional regulator
VATAARFVDRDQRPPTMAEIATTELRDAIVRGRLAPGTPLRLEELAQELRMSISPIRDAVRRLESLGFVEHEAHRGARVSLLSFEDLRDIIDVRVALEKIAVHRAAKSFTADNAKEARRALQRLDKAYLTPDIDEHLVANKAFHFTLYHASGAPWLTRQIVPAWENCERYAVALFDEPSLQSQRSKAEKRGHEKILKACIHNDPDAAVAELERHLEVFRSLTQRVLSGSAHRLVLS